MKTFADVMLSEIELSGKSPINVVWVGMHDGSLSLSWDEFAKQASAVSSDASYWLEHHIIVVFDDQSWLQYNGEFDNWSMYKLPTRTGIPFKIVVKKYGQSEHYTIEEAN